MKNLCCLAAILTLTMTATAQQTTPPPAPDISLSANGGSDNLYQGWPFIVHVTILNTEGDTAGGTGALVIAPNNAAWTTAITFTIQNSSGIAVQWPLTLVGTPSDVVLTLDPAEYVQASWQMSATDVSTLSPDTYTITANIQVAQSSGWNGSVQSPPVTITVGPEPTLTPDQQAEKVFQTAEFALNNNDLATAITSTQQLRNAQPDNATAGAVAANILKEAGYPSLAFLEASDALSTFYRVNPNPTEAPSDFLPGFQDLVTTMATPDTSVQPTSTLGSGASLVFDANTQTVSLNATVSASGTTVEGGTVTFTITGISGTATSQPVTAGSATTVFTVPGGSPVGSYTIQAVYGGTATFGGSNDSTASLTITPANPIVTWNPPADMHFGVPLGAGQLNATANVPGKFVYTPPAGTLLTIGKGQVLTVKFLPSDAQDYNAAAATVMVNVVAVPGDLNGDGVVNCADLAIVKASFGKKIGQPGFDSRADVNGDGAVNILDLSFVARQLPAGTTCQ